MPARLRLPPADGRPLWARLDAALRSAIEQGRWKPGDRLPSVADLAKHLGVSRLTVLKVFRALEKEGLLASHVGRGTFVTGGASQAGASGARSPSPAPPAPSPEPKPEVARALRRLREGWARGLRDLMSVERRPGTIDLSGGVPSPDTVPEGMLEKLARKVVRNDPRRLYAYPGPAGLRELREAIAKALSRSGTDVGPDEVIVTNGSQQAVSLVAAWAREDGRHVLCETPTYTGVPGSFMLFGHAVHGVPWEGAALDPAALAAAGRDRRPLLYACPDFHNPTGQTMPEAARRAIAHWARESGAVVLDDQIFRDLRFEGDPVPSLYATCAPGRRFLVGSISKSFMTGLRVGFLAADAATVRDLLPYKRHMDLGGPALVQAIAAAFLDDGYEEHVRKVRALYRARRDAALEALEEHLPAGTTWTRPEGGFQLWVTLPAGLSSIQLFLSGVERGVAVTPGPAHDLDGRYVSSFRLGYGSATPEEVRTGIRRLGEAAKALRSAPALDAPSLALHV
jgi:DNA-binding transcriptional MocR family regulator